jgi:DNA helicase-2/ATP-dependent DNA helicase PcrA
VNIAPAILREYPAINKEQRDIIEHDGGPLLVIAGPGSGKTFSLVLRTVNLLLLEKAKASELIVCTFTQKAAFELRDRIAAAARTTGYKQDLSELRVGTIHSICNSLLMDHRHRTPLGNNYETLDDLTQLLFIFDHFDEIVGDLQNGLYLGRWQSKWWAIEELSKYFNKITEELVDPEKLTHANDSFVVSLAAAYSAYYKKLLDKNKIDFAHQQKLVYDSLLDSSLLAALTNGIRYVMIDEYQDINHMQEQLLTKLASGTGNICVVGDEDQSLYRFRGATVRNILEFPTRFANCKIVKLTTNYRSHEKIVTAYDRWMKSANWSNPAGPPFRFDKTIQPDPRASYPNYPAVFAISGRNSADEAARFADLVAYLKKQNIITDYSQVALLLHSVRYDHSGPYIEALEKRGIPAFCPRARAYFENDEVRLMVACYAIIFGYYGPGRGTLAGQALQELAAYVDDCLVQLGKGYRDPHPLAKELQARSAEIIGLSPGEALDLRPADYLYRLLALEPFGSFAKNENRVRNLAILSQLLNVFQNYYHYTVVTHGNREYLRWHLFNSFLRLLYEGGINEYEDPDQPFPKGYVQVMTIHQAKGLEFPVAAVGSLDVQLSTAKRVDRDLQPFYHRPPFEPESRITEFDRMRLHYVAFSRPERLLVLTSDDPPKPHFAPIWQGLPQWPYVEKDLLAAQQFTLKDRMPVKRSYSFTGDLKVYETCPRQYEFFREYDFTPSRSAVIFFGLVVHQTIEEIHRTVMDGKLLTLNEGGIRELFDRTFYFLSLADVRPIGAEAREAAFRQVTNYFLQNQEEMKRVIETEVDVFVENDGYILSGKVDLLLGTDRKLEILDFKTAERPVNSPELLKAYERQLCTYAHILERRYGKRPVRLLLYWTSEALKKNALMEFPYRPGLVAEAGRHFDEVVGKIQARDFRILTVPESKICKECDLKHYCVQDGVLVGTDAPVAGGGGFVPPGGGGMNPPLHGR